MINRVNEWKASILEDNTSPAQKKMNNILWGLRKEFKKDILRNNPKMSEQFVSLEATMLITDVLTTLKVEGVNLYEACEAAAEAEAKAEDTDICGYFKACGSEEL